MFKALVLKGLALFNILKPLTCGIWDTKRVTAFKYKLWRFKQKNLRNIEVTTLLLLKSKVCNCSGSAFLLNV
jgi:hypothetical protein